MKYFYLLSNFCNTVRSMLSNSPVQMIQNFKMLEENSTVMERFFFSFFPVLLYIDRNIRKTKIKKVNFTNTFYHFQVIVFKLMVHIFDKLAFSDFIQKNLKLQK